MHRSILVAGVATVCAAGHLAAQRPVPYPVVPPPEYQRAIGQGTRTARGEPGPNYWQQWTDYRIRARLDPETKRVEGTVHLIYHNNAPRSLPVVFLHLHQNLHAEGAVRNEPQEVTGGVEVTRVTAGGEALDQGSLMEGPGYLVEGTGLAIRPTRSVRPGGSVTIEVDWSFLVPRSGSGRMGWNEDNLVFVAYWYPQMAVYDDVVGWHLDPYRGGAEFYAGFGSYDLTVEAPEGWLVMATGELRNADEVLPEPVYRRLREAESSDSVVHIITPDDFGPGRATASSDNGYLTWHFVADTVRDVAFSATRSSRWDAARTPVGDYDGDGVNDYARVDAIWRESAPRWQHAWRYGQHSIDFLSRWTGIPYPWPHMSSVEGAGIIGGGMEFPMMTLIGDYNQRGDSALYYVHAHELAHMWLPMIIGTDERRYAWMDEGTTTFNENQARKEFYPGFDPDRAERDSYLGVARAGMEGDMMRWSDYHYPGEAYGTASYAKPATLLATLRALLGEDVFVRAYREYLRRWRFRHPKPWDFFATFNSVSGQNLNWFWRSWYYEVWTLDQAVGSVTSNDDGTTIVIDDLGTVPMPVRITITRADGTTLEREVSVETWLQGATRTEVHIAGGARVTRVAIDARQEFPDIERRNNLWVAGT